MRLDDLLASTASLGGQVIGRPLAVEFDGLGYDSRRLRAGEIFVAIRTAKGDGHNFVQDAVSRGATGLLVEHDVPVDVGVTCVKVSDTLAALESFGAYTLGRYRPAVTAVTGSVGKTSTQQAIRAILTQGYHSSPAVFSNENYNDLIGVPIALSRLLPSHEEAIVELATDRHGELARLAEIIRPEMAVVTNVAPVYTKYLGSVDAIAREYATLLDALPASGHAILNADDERVKGLGVSVAGVLFCSARDVRAQLFAEHIRCDRQTTVFTLHTPFGSREVQLHLLGTHQAYNAMAAVAVGMLKGFALDEMVSALETLRPLPGRLNPIEGNNGTLVLDDTFSASPASVTSALGALAAFEAGRRFVVLGDMRDLGDLETAEHEKVGLLAANSCEWLICKGDKAAIAARAAKSAGMNAGNVYSTYSDRDVLTILSRQSEPGDIVLVKGSEEMRMERIVEELIPRGTVDQLVRQDAGWKQLVVLHSERPTWLEIDLGAIANNVALAKRIVGEKVEILAVLKADAYGHGASRVAQTALLHGASMLGTACLSEAVALRERGIAAPILVLGYTPPWQARDIVRNDIGATVYSLDVVRQLSRAALANGVGPAKIHLKVDTGMGRLGLPYEQVLPFAQEIGPLQAIEIEGIFTHFATADAPDRSYAEAQLERFQSVVKQLADAGIRPRYVHAANSAALLTMPESHFNLVRLGIALYGLNPSPNCVCPRDFRNALSFKTQVAQLKTLPTGSCVSYGCRFRTERPSTIAVIPVGYGDGFRRRPQNGGVVLVRGRRAPIVGVVCMDMCMVDVTDIPDVRQGDEVVIIGTQGNERISVDEMAEALGTINYEVVSQILPRVPREVS